MKILLNILLAPSAIILASTVGNVYLYVYRMLILVTGTGTIRFQTVDSAFNRLWAFFLPYPTVSSRTCFLLPKSA